MAIGCPIPNDISPLSSNGFRFSVARIPQLTYFSQEINFPNISLPDVEIGTPFVRYPIPGDVLSFSPLNLKFVVDSTMSNWLALFNWIRGIGFPENNEQYTEQIRAGTEYFLGENAAAMSDATLAVLGNNNNTVQTILFKDCVITDLGGFYLTTTDNDVNYIQADAIFNYAYYTFL